MIHYLSVLGNITGLGAGSTLVKDCKAVVEVHEMRCEHGPELDYCLARQNVDNSDHRFQLS